MVDVSDRGRSIEELERDSWGVPPERSTGLIAQVYRLRRMPIGELTVEDLRLLVGQQVALEIVTPLAVQRLVENPLAEGDLFEGDLLVAVLRLPAEFWSNHPGLTAALHTRLLDERACLTERFPLLKTFLDQRQ